MYYGSHGLTVLELPDGEKLYSRDVYSEVKVQRVIEIENKGKFLVYRHHFKFEQQSDASGVPNLDAPYFLHYLHVRPGDLQAVETDVFFSIGTDLRDDTSPILPNLRLTLYPPNYIKTPLQEARELYDEENAARDGKLSTSLRERIIGATVFVQCTYIAPGKQTDTSGSGFLISPRGYIVTNGHVVEPSFEDEDTQTQLRLQQVKVTLFSGRKNEVTLPATIVRYSAIPDLAVLKVDKIGLDFLCLDNDTVEEMQSVITAGYPGGTELAFSGSTPSVSFRAGHITAIRHSTNEKTVLYEHSSPIEQGSSGGPLLTPRGLVIGVNVGLAGPQHQSRLAISKETLRNFLFQETAEGKGPYLGPTPDERYIILIARMNMIHMFLSDPLFKLQGSSLREPNWKGDHGLPRDKAKTVAGDAIETLEYLLRTLGMIQPSWKHRLSHEKIREGFQTTKNATEKMLRLLADEADEKYVGSARAQLDTRNLMEKDWEYGSLSNEIQAGRTLLQFAFNRVIGMFWASSEEITTPAPPLQPVAQLDKYSMEAERELMNEIANIFLRHRGERAVIMKFPIDPWVRHVVYGDALVTGSPAMMRELQQLIISNGWGNSVE